MLKRILFFLIILFLPTQLGRHFWPSFTQVAGFRIDYLSPTIYFSDILILFYILSGLPRLLHFLKAQIKAVIFLFAFVSLNLLFSLSPLSTLFVWLRWLYYLMFIATLRVNRVKSVSVLLPLSFSVIFIVFLEIAQFFRQASLGGPFYFLGERAFNQATPHVAKFIFNNDIFIRSYATFSHPNSLAGFLLISLFLFRLNRYSLLVQIIATIGIMFSFSKTVIASTLFYLSGLFRKNTLPLLLFLPLAVLILSPLPISSLINRTALVMPTLSIISQYPIFGVGLGGNIPSLAKNLPGNKVTPALLQPVHNLPLLVIAETGLFGLLVLASLVLKTKIYKDHLFIEFLSLILLTGGFDHYWLTLPQNKLILLIGLYLTLSHKS